MSQQITDYKRIVAEMAAERQRQIDALKASQEEAGAAALAAAADKLAPLLAVLQSVADDPALDVRNVRGPSRGPWGTVWPSVRPVTVQNRVQAGTVTIMIHAEAGKDEVRLNNSDGTYHRAPIESVDKLIPVLLGHIADMKTVRR